MRTPHIVCSADSAPVVSIDDFEALYIAYSRRVIGVIYRLVEHHETSEDIAQDAWIKAWRALASGTTIEAEAARTWLFKIAANTAYDYLRRRQFMLLSLESGVEVPTTERFEARIERRELAVHVLRAMTPEEARLLLAVFGRDMPYSRLEATLHLEPSALKMRVLRARQRFKALYQQETAGQGV
jgi:RNA polymerase sigma-70 factor (ECF subfamily)